MDRWATGHALPGCLPDGDVDTFEHWSSAQENLLDDFKVASGDHDLGDAPDGWVEAWDALAADLRSLQPGCEWYGTGPDEYVYYLNDLTLI